MSVCCDLCLLSDRGLCVGLITRPEESYTDRDVALCVIYKSQALGAHGQRWAAAPQKKKWADVGQWNLL